MIKLTENQKEILLDHMNKKLSYILEDDCGFCIVAEELQINTPDINIESYGELYCFCFHCPLSSSRNGGDTCITTRNFTLRDSEDSPVDTYYQATEKSIENRIDYLIDMVNEHTNAKFGWLRNIKGEDKVIDYEQKKI